MTESVFLTDEFGTKFNMWGRFRYKGLLILFLINVIAFQCFICKYFFTIVRRVVHTPPSSTTDKLMNVKTHDINLICYHSFYACCPRYSSKLHVKRRVPYNLYFIIIICHIFAFYR